MCEGLEGNEPGVRFVTAVVLQPARARLAIMPKPRKNRLAWEKRVFCMWIFPIKSRSQRNIILLPLQ